MAGNLRGIGNGGPVRLVSPAPVIINSANGQPQPPAALRLLPSQVITWHILLCNFITLICIISKILDHIIQEVAKEDLFHVNDMY